LNFDEINNLVTRSKANYFAAVFVDVVIVVFVDIVVIVYN